VRGWRVLYRHDNETSTVTVLRVLPRDRAYDR
jgi:mRNA-degrading endonuclease RelE of RelBE toxin-antitoxin system